MLILLGFLMIRNGPNLSSRMHIKQLKILGYWSSPAKIILIDFVTDRQRVIWQHPVELDQICYLAKSRSVFFTIKKSDGLELNSVMLDGSSFRHLMTLPKGAGQVAVSSDAKHLAYMLPYKENPNKYFELISQDIPNGPKQVVLRVTHPSVIGDPTFTQDGLNLSFWRDDKYHAKLYIQSTAPRSIARRIIEYPGHQRSPKWSPNGNRILFNSDHVEHAYSWVVENFIGGKIEASSQQGLDVGVGALWASNDAIIEFVQDRARIKVPKDEDLRPHRYAIRTLDGRFTNLELATSEFDPTAVVSYEVEK